MLFEEPSGKSSQAQMSAFEDTWHCGMESEKALQEIATSPIAPAATKEFMFVLPISSASERIGQLISR
jgi:hypothetical protein